MLSDPPVPKGEAGLQALQVLLRQRSILAALESLHKELGDVFRLSLPGFNPVVLVGPEANRFVLITARGDLHWRPEGDPVTELLRHGVLVEDGERHDQLRRHMNPALHRRMLPGYVEAMVRCTDRVSRSWNDSVPHDMLVEMRRIALLILTDTMFEVDFGPELDRLFPAILRILSYISPGLWLLWRGVPRPGYRQARRQIDEYLHQIIQARRAVASLPGQPGDGPPDDLLGLLVTTSGMSDDLIRDQLLTMLIAGHDTSTALLAWALYLLGRHPDVMARVQDEVDRVLGADIPTFDQLNQLQYLEQVIKETLRLYPPIHLGMRIAATDLAFQGYRIPAGTRVMYSIYLTHRHQQYWPQPERFDPERFSSEQNRARPHYIYLPFGGGPRNCLGFAFAHVEAKIVLARIFQNFSLKLDQTTRVHPHMGATLEPRPGVWMSVQRRS
jgi:cytochrome P450